MNYLLSVLMLFTLWSCSTEINNQVTDSVMQKGLVMPENAILSKSGKMYFTGLKVPMGFTPANTMKVSLRETLPVAFDWREKFQLSPIENQGSCGSCWAFSTAATFQDVKRIFGETEDISEQYLLSCANPSEWSCDGGFFAHDAHKAPRGAVLASEYPYTASDSACKSNLNYQWKLTSWSYLSSGENPSVDEIKQAIYKYGPVSVGVAADSTFSSYSGGIFQGSGSTQLNHAVNIVGWGDGYWIMRNSWGASWGENGYMRIKFKANGIGAWANFVVYNGPTPTPDPDPNPNPNPTPEPTPDPTPEPDCKPLPVANTGYADTVTVRQGAVILVGSKALKGHRYYWTADPAFDGGATPEEAKIKYRPKITKTLTVHAVTKCGEATDSVTVKVASAYQDMLQPELDD